MVRKWFVLAGVWAGLVGVGGNGSLAGAQEASAAAQAKAPAVRKTCRVDASGPTPGETALNKGQFADAEKLLRAVLEKSPNSDAVHEALIRALIEQNKVSDAAKDAEAWIKAEPGNSLALVGVGEVRYLQGDPLAAYDQFQQAVQADICNARAYFGLARVDGLSGMHASAKRFIEQAYVLHPTDDEINSWWISTRQRKERLEKLADYAERSTQITDEERAKLKTNLAKESVHHTSDCRMAATSPRETTVSMAPVMAGPGVFSAWGLDVKLNGKRRRLEIDTGASGITISSEAAAALGLEREDAGTLGGFGDDGRVKVSTVHVASIKVGGIEFTNCAVDIVDKWNVPTDGLIGGDVFDASLLTLDFPKRELRLAPLPARPGEKKQDPAADSEGDDQVVVAHDPYIAPEMANWVHIYRNGHFLLAPGGIVETKLAKYVNAWKQVIFLLDTGADFNSISPAAAAQVTKVYEDPNVEIRGISGKVKKVFEAGKFTLAFSGLRLDSPSMTAVDMTNISKGAGVEVSGTVGAPALRQVVMHIDYRDNLLWCEYTAKD